METSSKVQISVLASALALIGTIVTSWVFIDDRYAHAADVDKLEQNTVKALERFERTAVVKELNKLSIKENSDGLTAYDKILKEQLERELDTMMDSTK